MTPARPEKHFRITIDRRNSMTYRVNDKPEVNPVWDFERLTGTQQASIDKLTQSLGTLLKQREEMQKKLSDLQNQINCSCEPLEALLGNKGMHAVIEKIGNRL